MTKKHFIALADTIRAVRPVGLGRDVSNTYPDGIAVGKLTQWQFMMDCLGDFCQDQNPQFNRQRWLDYIDGKCGPNGGKLK